MDILRHVLSNVEVECDSSHLCRKPVAAEGFFKAFAQVEEREVGFELALYEALVIINHQQAHLHRNHARVHHREEVLVHRVLKQILLMQALQEEVEELG